VKSRAFLFVFVAALSLTGPAASRAQVVKPLIQLHLSVTLHVRGTQYADQDLFLANDGTATGQVVTRDPAAALGWVFTARTARASAAQIAALQGELGSAMIGQQVGGCRTGSRFFSTGVAELRWYGRGYRKNTINVQIGGGDEGVAPCPPELQQLFYAIEDFSGAVLGENVGP
jgi:hypothetical protein